MTPLQKRPNFHQKSPIFYITFYTRIEMIKAATKQERQRAYHLHHCNRALFSTETSLHGIIYYSSGTPVTETTQKKH